MTPFPFMRGGARLVGYDDGAGVPVVFQHGLGSSLDQVEETVIQLPGVRRLTLEGRAHGASAPGPERPFSIAMFAEDVLAFADARGAERFVAGGISLGAAIALRLAVRHRARVCALLLVRPAWLFDAAPPNLRPHAEVAAALRSATPAAARAAFARSDTAARLTRETPAALASLLRWFDRPDPASAADLLAGIAGDGPGVSRAEVAALRLPTLVIGHGGDPAHPLATARTLAATIPGSRLVEVPPKAGSTSAHLEAVEDAVTRFLTSIVHAGAA